MDTIQLFETLRDLCYYYDAKLCMSFVEHTEIDPSCLAVAEALAASATGTNPTYVIADENIPYLLNKIDITNRRITKKGAPEVGVTALYKYSMTAKAYNRYFGKTNAGHDKDLIPVTVFGCPLPDVRIDGYKLAGIIQHDWTVVCDVDYEETNSGGLRAVYSNADMAATKAGGATNMVVMSEGYESDPSYFEGYHCDQCKIDRVRKNSLVIHDTNSDTILRMGTTCAKDFLGNSIEKFLIMAKSYEAVKHMFEGAGSMNPTPEVGLVGFLTMCAAFVDRVGFVSRGKSSYEVPATADLAINEYYHPDKFARNIPAEDWDRHEATAIAAIDFIRSDDFNGASDYITNMKTVFHARRVGSVPRKQCGFAASAISAYLRYQAELNAPQVESEWLGEVKQRLRNLDLTLTRKHLIDGMYGYTTILTFHDSAGSVAVWFASGWRMDEFDIGVTYDITGTVKKLGTYKGAKQTTLTRCKVH